MSRRLLLLGNKCLSKAYVHSIAAGRVADGLGIRNLHCQTCLVVPSIDRNASNYLQVVPSRGLHSRPDPTRRQGPDMLYSRVELELRAHDPAVLNSYTEFLQLAARHLGVTTGKLYEPPRHFHRLSLLKSVHIFAKHKVQYEARTYFRVLELLRLTGSTADTYLEYTQRMLPEGVAMKVTRHAREALPEHLSSRPEQRDQRNAAPSAD